VDKPVNKHDYKQPSDEVLPHMVDYTLAG